MTTYKLGPGTLKLGAGDLAIEALITNARIDWSESVRGGSDDVDLLNGGVEPGEDGQASHTATLAANLFQDISAAGVVEWSWTNRGTEQPFTFVPSTAEGRQVTGVCFPVPITIGGDVKTKPRSDISWRCSRDGLPELGNVAP